MSSRIFHDGTTPLLTNLLKLDSPAAIYVAAANVEE